MMICINSNPIFRSVLYSFFFFLTCLHIFANIRAVKSVCLRRFNESRYLIALEEYFRTTRMLTVAEVNGLERVTVGRTVSVSMQIYIGLSVHHLTDQYRSANDIQSIIDTYESTHEKFLIAEHDRFIGIYLHLDARPQDILKAYFYAVSYLQDRNQLKDRYWEVTNKWNDFLAAAHKEGTIICWYLMRYEGIHSVIFVCSNCRLDHHIAFVQRWWVPAGLESYYLGPAKTDLPSVRNISESTFANLYQIKSENAQKGGE